MEEAEQQGLLGFHSEGNPPERYQLMLDSPGLALIDGSLVKRRVHRCEVYLHRDYPRRPPVVVWTTPVFHPNLLSPERNGGVCIGTWSASESLPDLVRRLKDMIAWRSFNTGDALDLEAADWVLREKIEPGIDLDELVGLEVNASRPLTGVEVH